MARSRNFLSGSRSTLAFSLLISFSFLFTNIGTGAPENYIEDVDEMTRSGSFSATIFEWYDNATAALTLSFDDGVTSQAVNASPLMSLLGLRGTFFITPDNVGIPYGATWAQWQDTADAGHEIASHTITHPDLTTCTPEELHDEVVLSKNIIRQNLSGVKCETFSYPMGSFNETVMDLVKETYIGARTDTHNITGPPRPVPRSPDDPFFTIPVRFGSVNTDEELNGLVNTTLESGEWLVEMIHAIGSGGYDPVDIADFISHIVYISEMEDLWVAPFVDVVKYYKTRDSSTITIEHPQDYVWDVSLNSDLDGTVYDHPLTVNLTFPSDWVDLEVYYKGQPSTITTHRGDGYRWLQMELALGHPLRLIKSNFNPRIESYNPDGDITEPYFPLNGTSEEIYTFYLNYSSSMNRAPSEDPLVWFDLNRDGDMEDTINGHAEGRYSMQKKDIFDMDHTDGCIFFLKTQFPPGTDMAIRFSAVDEEGLESISSTYMGPWTSGPLLNDAPTLSGDIEIISNHTRNPTFFWPEGFDPDGDQVRYELMLWSENGTLDHHTIIVPAKFTIPYDLGFSIDHLLQVTCLDEIGLRSSTLEIEFDLSNRRPPPIQDIIVNFFTPLVPTFTIISEDDIDGDRLEYRLLVKEIHEENSSLVLDIIQWDNSTFLTNIILDDHTIYELSARTTDEFGLQNWGFTRNFYLNIPPAPVTGLKTRDLVDEEDGIILLWNASIEDDLEKYLIYRYDAPVEELTPDNADTIFEVVGNTTYIDRDVRDGETYCYGVVAVDRDGAFNWTGLNTIEGTSIDDVAPLRVSNINASVVSGVSGPLIRITWNGSSDERFSHYSVYRSLEELDDVSALAPVANISDRSDTIFEDPSILWNTTYHYTVAVVDSSGNGIIENLTWSSSGYFPEFAAPSPDDDDDDDTDLLGWALTTLTIAALLGGACYVAFIVMGRRSFTITDEE